MAERRREQTHTQRPTEVQVLRGDAVVADTTAELTVRLVYDDEVPDATDWDGRFPEAEGGFDQP